METASMVLTSGVVIVFEGLDAAGKSTQLALLEGVLDPELVVLAHMPSGFGPFTRKVYAALESPFERPVSDLARQLAHIACHAESMPKLAEAVRSKALVLDRWWWSTVAYGWYGGAFARSGLPEDSLRDLMKAVWHPIEASVVFVFLEPNECDINNTESVVAGYRALLHDHFRVAVQVPSGDALHVHSFIVKTLMARGLMRRL